MHSAGGLLLSSLQLGLQFRYFRLCFSTGLMEERTGSNRPEKGTVGGTYFANTVQLLLMVALHLADKILCLHFQCVQCLITLRQLLLQLLDLLFHFPTLVLLGLVLCGQRLK